MLDEVAEIVVDGNTILSAAAIKCYSRQILVDDYKQAGQFGSL